MDEDVGELYKHLLNPIREASANWDINFKECLDDYLEKLRRDRGRTVVREDGEVVRFNFSEAAQLLQGSLMIFSRKVDALYDEITESYMGLHKKKKKSHATDQTLDASLDTSDFGRIKNDFELLDEKVEMLNETIDIKWLLEQNGKREKRAPVRVGNRREFGRRDRLVDLPISFIPTKKTAPSIHHFSFKQNNEEVYIAQSDLFSFNSIAFASSDGTQMTVFINSAYLELVHNFSAEYIPYLRDVNNHRLQRLGEPYNIDAPAVIYNNLINLDERENRGNESQDFLEIYYAQNGAESPDSQTVVDLTFDSHPPDVPNGIRASSVEAPRESGIRSSMEGTVPRFSEFPNIDSINHPGDTTSEALFTRSHAFNNSMASNALSTVTEIRLDVDEELLYLDEYADVKPRLRNVTKPKDRKRKRVIYKGAKELCTLRDEKIKEKFSEVGKDYDIYKNNLSDYITAKLFSRKLCTVGSILENINPRLRDRQIQALNRVLYVQEKYEKNVRAQRRQQEMDKERLRKKEDQRMRREREKLKQLENLQSKKRRQPPETETAENYEPKPEFDNEVNDDLPDDIDYFGAQPDEDDAFDAANENNPDDEYNPAARMAQEIDELGGGPFEDDDELQEEVNIFPTYDSANTAPTNEMNLGDHNWTMNETQTMDLGSFATNDPAFFDLEKLAEFFLNTQMDGFTDSDVLLNSIQSFWEDTNKKDKGNCRERLQLWSSHILERLDDDARHKPFAIHDYGTTILNKFEEEIGKIVKFKEIVKDVPKYEVSRYLLALLILANCGNVEIISEGQNAVGSAQPVINKRTSIKLLSMERHHEIFQSEQLLVTG